MGWHDDAIDRELLKLNAELEVWKQRATSAELQINELKEAVQFERSEKGKACEDWGTALEKLKKSNRLLGEAHELLRAYMTRFWGDYAGHCAGCKDLPCWTDHLLERTEPEKRVGPDQKICGAVGITGGLCQNPIPCPLH